jgi:hypothetical protein
MKNDFKEKRFKNYVHEYVNYKNIFLRRQFVNRQRMVSIFEMMKLWGFEEQYVKMLKSIDSKMKKGEYCIVENSNDRVFAPQMYETHMYNLHSKKILTYTIFKNVKIGNRNVDIEQSRGLINFNGKKIKFVNK